MKQNKTLLRELREELHYWQQMARIEARCLAGSRRKCKEIGAMMRRLQPEPERHPALRAMDWRPAPFGGDFSQPDLLAVNEAKQEIS